MAKKTTVELGFEKLRDSTGDLFARFLEHMQRKKRNGFNSSRYGAFASTEFTRLYVQKLIDDTKKLALSDDERNKIVAERISASGFIQSSNIFSSYYLWATTKNIYKFDDTFLDEILEGEWYGEVASNIFDFMPFDPVAIDVSKIMPEFSHVIIRREYKHITRSGYNFGDNAGVREIDAFNAIIQGRLPKMPFNPKRNYLHFAFSDKEINAESGGHSYELSLNGNTLDEMLGSTMDILSDQIFLNTTQYDNETLGITKDMSAKERKLLMKNQMLSDIEKVLPLLIYICSYQPDIELVTPQKVLEKNPDTIRKFQVGATIGNTLRQARRVYEKELEAEGTGHEPTGRSVRPHARRGHFRNQWYGPKNGDRIQRTIWISPSLINAKNVMEAQNVRVNTFVATEQKPAQ